MATRENEVERKKVQKTAMLQFLCSGLETVEFHSFADHVELSVFCHNLLNFYSLSIIAMVFTLI